MIAVDNSEKMVEFGKKLARKHGVKNWSIDTARWKPFPSKTAK